MLGETCAKRKRINKLNHCSRSHVEVAASVDALSALMLTTLATPSALKLAPQRNNLLDGLVLNTLLLLDHGHMDNFLLTVRDKNVVNMFSVEMIILEMWTT